ncbi:MAG TPA: hypothetical protein PK954_13985 [Anaerolineales bacterium]|nr:hypothetical protein [Anaerolineales bacterium]HRF50257.1 hypothetical protein [Anaerolineales bacterium]
MSETKWVPIRKIFCHRVKAEVELLMEDTGRPDYFGELTTEGHQPRKQCALGESCNLIGLKCQWSYTNPGYDPFEDA